MMSAIKGVRLMMTRPRVLLGTLLVFGCGILLGTMMASRGIAHAQSAPRVFEIRTYTAAEGKLDAMHVRIRDRGMPIFQRLGMTNIAYFKPQDAPLSQNTLIYILAYPSREAAKKAWADFSADPEWKKVSAETDANGKIVSKVESVFVDPADYSPLK